MCRVFAVFNNMTQEYVIFTRSEGKAYKTASKRWVYHIHEYELDKEEPVKKVYTNIEKFKMENL